MRQRVEAELSRRLARRSRGSGQGGFTLIELLVVIIILGILAAVVVFAVGGVGDKGAAAAMAEDARTLRTAEEAHLAQFGTYATEAQLVSGGLLSEESTLHDIVLVGGSGGSFTVNNQAPANIFGQVAVDDNSSVGTYRITCSREETGCGEGGATPLGGTIRVAGTSSAANVTGNNFINPAVTSSGTVHPNTEYMFNGLLRWAENNTAQPDLAQSFAVSADQRTASFTLRSGLKWHNGTDITANDVKFSAEEGWLKRHSRTAASLGEALGTVNPNTTTAVTPANAIDCGQLNDPVPTACTPTSLTVRFNFGFPYPTLLRQMNVTEAPIIPENVYGACRYDAGGPGTDNIDTSACAPNNPASGDFPAVGPVGSGPFKFKSRDQTTAQLVFVKNPTYHFAGLPLVDELIQVPTGNSATALLNDQIDFGSPAGNTVPPVPDGLTFVPTVTPQAGFQIASVPRGSGGGNCITQPGFNLWAVGQTPAAINAGTATPHPIFGDPTMVDPDGAGPEGPMARGKVVRRAISMALDRQLMFNANEFGKGAVPTSPVHSKLAVYAPQPNMAAFDRAKADLWLTNAGWTLQAGPGGTVRRSTGAPGMPAAGSPLSWPLTGPTTTATAGGSARTTGNQTDYWTSIDSQLLAAPIEISANLNAAGALAPRAAETSTQAYAPYFGNRNFDIITVNYCQGDDPVVGMRRQYFADSNTVGAPRSQISTANFTNAAGYRNSEVDALWDARNDSAFGPMQSIIASDAPYIWLAETGPQRAWKNTCTGFNIQNTGLFAEAASCA
ncbi:MAG: ABC transporter substrate-binding protein [Acidimicrobiales bacterium]